MHPVRSAARLLGLSTSTLYRLAAVGDVKLKRLAGRTMVETSELIRLLSAAEDWTPSPRTKRATAARWS